MAESAVGLVVDKLIPLLTEEAYLLRGIHKEVEGIKCDLRFILAFLNDADRKAEAEQRTKSSQVLEVWVQELRKAAFKLEDVIDEYTHLMVQQQRPHSHKFIGFLRKSACLIIKLKPRRDIASKIEDLRKTVREINEKGKTYHLSSLPQGSVFTRNDACYDPRNDSRFLRETEVVGIETIRDELLARIEGGSPKRTVISVVGMGGLGKTTLARQVYVRCNRTFDCHAWINVSQSYDKVELLRNLTKNFYQSKDESVPKGIELMDQDKLTEDLRDYLSGKRYVVIFDDVWNTNFWGDIKNALPDNNEKHGRIVITTRNVEVANYCKISSSVHVHQLKPLHPDKAWELFCSKAFHSERETAFPTHLKELSHKILERCGGLPLAIVLIAGVLSTKGKTEDEWRKLYTSLSSELKCNEHLTSITTILSLSYIDLDYHLKSCFLYFGIFPGNYSIRYRRLIRQWIAEGFVEPKEDKTLEEVAEEYLAELINRSLVQVTDIDFDGKAKSCRVHDLLCEIILKKMQDLNFCRIISGDDSNFRGLTRRLSIVHSHAFESYNETSHVRSLFFFDKDKLSNLLIRAIAKNFGLLKVLDFEDAPGLDHLPEDIGNLFHLRYLSVRGTQVQELPKSIGKLENLETLDMKPSLVYELPAEINRLQKLRDLLAYNIDYKAHYHINRQRGVKVKRGIGRLKALQRLYFIEANVDGVDLFKELSKLTRLRKLGIKKLRSEDGRDLCICIQKMEHLESLDIASISENETIDLESMSSPPQFLQRLYLKGHLRKFPEWIKQLRNLVRIRISWSKLEDDPLKVLQNLHNLLELGINLDAHYGGKLHFEGGVFPRLKVLHLRHLSRLTSIVIEEGALCDLEEFDIGPSPEMEEVPSGFQHLRNLKICRFYEMPMHFLTSQTLELLNFVPNVRFLRKIDGTLAVLSLKLVFELRNFIKEHNEVDWNSLPVEEMRIKVDGIWKMFWKQ